MHRRHATAHGAFGIVTAIENGSRCVYMYDVDRDAFNNQHIYSTGTLHFQ